MRILPPLIPAVLACLGLGGLCSVPAATAPEGAPGHESIRPGIRTADWVDMASAKSRTAHVAQTRLGKPFGEVDEYGTLALPVAGMRLEPGGAVRVQLQRPAGEPATVVVTLATVPADCGKPQNYRVRLDGQEAYRAVESDPGAGPTRSLCFDLPAGGKTCDVEVAADPTTQAPIMVASVRCLSGINHQPSTINPMGLALLSPDGAGYQLDAKTLRDLAHKLPDSPYLERQAAVLYNFCARAAPENRAEIARLVGLPDETGVPLRIAFQMEWGGTPKGVGDGAGGTFTDLPYQQITFDPDNQVEAPGLKALMGDRYDKRFGLSVPNRWSDTPWLTYNHPRLNQLRRIRLTQALTAWREARERLADAGKANLLPLELSTGEETVYWANGVDDSKYTAANGGKPRTRLMADFNPFTVADAQRDGVNLDPRDGLDAKERWWLHENLAAQQQRIVDWMFDALRADPVRLKAGSGTGGAPVAPAGFAADLTRRNLFTEPYAMPLFPMKALGTTHPGLEVGYVHNGRSGGEYWSGATMLPWLLKERERGRIALPNLECTGAGDAQLVACLQAAYACGARFATLYNWHHRPNAAQLLRQFADSIEQPPAIELPTADAPAPGKPWEWTYTAPPGAFGVNCVELTTDQPLPQPVHVRLRAADGSASYTVAAVPEPSPQSAIVLPTLFPQQPGRQYVLTVEAPAGSAAEGKVGARLVADLRRERARSEALAAWQDARDLLDSLQSLHARTAQSQFAAEALEAAEKRWSVGDLTGAYRAGIRAEQLALPAAFAVPAPGARLAPYWVTVLCPSGPVRATITAYSPKSAVVSVRSAVAQRVTLRWGGAETTAQLSPDVPAEITLDQPKPGAPAVKPVTRRPGKA